MLHQQYSVRLVVKRTWPAILINQQSCMMLQRSVATGQRNFVFNSKRLHIEVSLCQAGLSRSSKKQYFLSSFYCQLFIDIQWLRQSDETGEVERRREIPRRAEGEKFLGRVGSMLAQEFFYF